MSNQAKIKNNNKNTSIKEDSTSNNNIDQSHKHQINSRNNESYSKEMNNSINKSQKTTKDGTPTKEPNNPNQTFDSLSNMSDIFGQPILTYSKLYNQSTISFYI